MCGEASSCRLKSAVRPSSDFGESISDDMLHDETKRLLVLLVSTALFGQAPTTRPEFEVASIKVSAPDEFDRTGAGSHVDGSQVSFKFLSLSNYIAYAYHVKNYAISGPDWMASARFDITAKLPADATTKQLPEMLQALLEDPFQTKVHRESKELPVYAMVIGKGGLKMQELSPDSPTSTQYEARQGFNASVVPRRGGVTVNYGNGTYCTFAANKLEGRRMKVSSMANVFGGFPGSAGGRYDRAQGQLRLHHRTIPGRLSRHANPGCGRCGRYSSTTSHPDG